MFKIKRDIGKVRGITELQPDMPHPPLPQVPTEQIAAAVQVIACKDGQVYISAPADPIQAYLLLIDGLIETRNRHMKAMEAQLAEKEKMVMPFPAGVIPK